MHSPCRLPHPSSADGRRRRSGVIAAVTVLVLALTATVAEPLVTYAAPIAEADTTAVAAPDPAPTPFWLEIVGAMETESARVAALQADFDAAPNEAEALAIQREIEAVKAETEREILHIQARHALAAGRVDDAEHSETAAQRLTEPQPVGQPAPRPAPIEGRQATAR